MGFIWIKCPATGRKAPIGIETDATSFVRFPNQLQSIRCPACGMRHKWLKDDAWLADASSHLALLLRRDWITAG
jgi:hypothetical protein